MAILADAIPERGQEWQDGVTDPTVARAARTFPPHRARVVSCLWSFESRRRPIRRSYQIALTTDDFRQLQITFAAQWQRAPSPEEMRGLVEQKIREEILYREALQLGLDKDDVIIKRRLAQKMQFLAEDVGAAHEPTTAELKAWYVKNSGQFALPSRFSFRHLYFSPDRRGQQAHDDAMKALTRSEQSPKSRRQPRLWLIGSCSRIIMQTARRKSWRRSSGRNLLRPSKA